MGVRLARLKIIEGKFRYEIHEGLSFNGLVGLVGDVVAMQLDALFHKVVQVF